MLLITRFAAYSRPGKRMPQEREAHVEREWPGHRQSEWDEQNRVNKRDRAFEAGISCHGKEHEVRQSDSKNYIEDDVSRIWQSIETTLLRIRLKKTMSFASPGKRPSGVRGSKQ